MPKKLINDNKGITLIAVIITLIVLIILASTSISMIIGEGGTITRAIFARNKFENTIEEEQEKIDEKKDELLNIIEKEKENKNSDRSTYEGVINQDDDNFKLPSTTETFPYFPDDNFSYVEGTINTGLVIENNNTKSQYVWIEVPKTASGMTKVTPVDSNNITLDEASLIINELIAYTSNYQSNAYSDNWYSGCGLTQTEYYELGRKTAQSIYNYGGFWISRFEAGTSDGSIRNSTTTDLPDAVFKYDQIPYFFVTVSQAQELAQRDSGEEYTSSLLFGLQWDLTCKFMQEKGYLTDGRKLLEEDINTDSEDLGNYLNTTFTLNRAGGKYSTDSGNNFSNISDLTSKVKDSETEYLLTTGASEQNKVLNIYDMAGNEYEWTLERFDTTDTEFCTARGGSNSYNSNTHYLNSRAYNTKTYSNINVVFRTVLVKN